MTKAFVMSEDEAVELWNSATGEYFEAQLVDFAAKAINHYNDTIPESVLSDSDARIQDYAEQHMLTLEEAVDALTPEGYLPAAIMTDESKRMSFSQMCAALPEGFSWGDSLTPDVFQHIEQAARTAPAARNAGLTDWQREAIEYAAGLIREKWGGHEMKLETNLRALLAAPEASNWQERVQLRMLAKPEHDEPAVIGGACAAPEALPEAAPEAAPVASQEGKCNCSVHLMSRTDVGHAANCPASEPIARDVLTEAVYTVLEGFTLPPDVRKILETAYYTALKRG
jgi:hypothetical protein